MSTEVGVNIILVMFLCSNSFTWRGARTVDLSKRDTASQTHRTIQCTNMLTTMRLQKSWAPVWSPAMMQWKHAAMMACKLIRVLSTSVTVTGWVGTAVVTGGLPVPKRTYLCVSSTSRSFWSKLCSQSLNQPVNLCTYHAFIWIDIKWHVTHITWHTFHITWRVNHITWL